MALLALLPLRLVHAEIDLVLSPSLQSVTTSGLVGVDLIARPSGGSPETFTSIDAIVLWEPAFLELEDVEFFEPDLWQSIGIISGLPAEPCGLNASLSDGDAFVSASAKITFPPTLVDAPGVGLSVLRMWFRAPDERGAFVIRFAQEAVGLCGTRVRNGTGPVVTGETRSTARVVVEGDLLAGDCDANSLVDLLDWPGFSDCVSGVMNPFVVGVCGCADIDNDEDVDLVDYAYFQLLSSPAFTAD